MGKVTKRVKSAAKWLFVPSGTIAQAKGAFKFSKSYRNLQNELNDRTKRVIALNADLPKMDVDDDFVDESGEPVIQGDVPASIQEINKLTQEAQKELDKLIALFDVDKDDEDGMEYQRRKLSNTKKLLEKLNRALYDNRNNPILDTYAEIEDLTKKVKSLHEALNNNRKPRISIRQHDPKQAKLLKQNCATLNIVSATRIDHEGIHTRDVQQIKLENLTVFDFIRVVDEFNERQHIDSQRISYTINSKGHYIKYEGNAKAIEAFDSYLLNADKEYGEKDKPEEESRLNVGLT